MAQIISKDLLKKIYSRRPENSKKYDFGNLLVIGGSDYYSGAPALSALAAFAAGVDMVRVAAPKRASDIIAAFSPILATTSLDGGRLNKSHLCVLDEIIRTMAAVSPGKCAVVIGGGIGRSQDSIEAIREFIFATDIPMVIDADAIRALVADPEKLAGKSLLLTPHAREFEELTGNDVSGKTNEEKIVIVANQAKSLGVTIILKGEVDVISDGNRTVLNETGTALMTKGGTGDTLAGIAGALLARGAEFFDVASAAAYINGIAGQLAGAERGEGMTAMDLINQIPNVLPKHRYE
jgi:NAD(P)H-hydrate epimerase